MPVLYFLLQGALHSAAISQMTEKLFDEKVQDRHHPRHDYSIACPGALPPTGKLMYSVTCLVLFRAVTCPRLLIANVHASLA